MNLLEGLLLVLAVLFTLLIIALAYVLKLALDQKPEDFHDTFYARMKILDQVWRLLFLAQLARGSFPRMLRFRVLRCAVSRSHRIFHL